MIGAIAIGAGLGLACSGRNGGVADGMWTERQAASITTIRGTPVRVRYCHGLGGGQEARGVIVYGSFSCLAGARIASQAFDSVAVTYVLRPAGAYAGRASRYILANVRFEALMVP